jgi:hypothetical protein
MYLLKQNVNAMFTVRFSRFRLNTYKSYTRKAQLTAATLFGTSLVNLC